MTLQPTPRGKRDDDNVLPTIDNGSVSAVIAGGTESTKEERRPTQYDAFSRAPFIIMIKKISPNTVPRKQVPAIDAARKMAKANIKFDKMKKYSFNTWQVTFKAKSTANNAITNIYLKEMGYTAFIPRYKLSRKIVIRDIPLDMPLEEIKRAVEEENANIMIEKMYRMKARDRVTKQLKESLSICMEIKGEIIPKEIILFKTINKASPYVPSVKLCYNCRLFGHMSRACNREMRCLTCADNHSFEPGNPCGKTSRCINCKGQHGTRDRECPTFQKQLAIAKIMAHDNLPFLAARRMYERQNKNINQEKDIILKNFPLLPGNSGSNLLTGEKNDVLWSSILKKGNGNDTKKIQELIKKIIKADELETLLGSLLKAVDIHNNVTIKRKNG